MNTSDSSTNTKGGETGLSGTAGSALSLKQMWAKARRIQKARERKAGKHRCVASCVGAARRVTGRDGRILKRPVVIVRYYECKICGRDMTPNIGDVGCAGEARPPHTQP